MESRHQISPLFRLFPSLTDVAFLAPMLLLFIRLDGVKTMLGDGDTGWHIRAGEWMLANGRVPQTDMFSFTKAGEPWYAWEWLSDIILAVLHQRFGLAGPVYMGIILLGITAVLLYRLCRRHTNNDLLAIGVTAVTMGASSIHWLARPHLFTFLFLVITLHLLDRAYTNPRILWYFPPMVALWTNLHGAFFVAIILLITTGVGVFLHRVTAEDSQGIQEGWNTARTYFTVAAVSGLASLVNPYGWGLHKHIYQYLTEKYHFDHIVEFQTLSFHAPVAMFFEVLVIGGLLTIGWSVSRRRFADALLLLSWLHLALVAGRNIPIYAFLAAPLITRCGTEAIVALQTARVAEWIRRAAKATEAYAAEFSQTDRVPRLHVVSGFASALLLAVLLGAPADSNKLRAEYDSKKYPEGALKLLDGRRVFTNDEWGDYLIYKLYPKTKVFVDGRSDFYGPEFSLRYLDVVDVKWDWATVLAKYDVDTILMPANAPLASTLKQMAGWKPVYDDQISILFFATGKSTRRLPDGDASLPMVSETKPHRKTEAAAEMAYRPKPQL